MMSRAPIAGEWRQLLSTLGVILITCSAPGCGRPADPRPRWVTATERDILSDPSLSGTLLYVMAGDALYALSTFNGAVRWRQGGLKGGRPTHPLVAGQLVYVAGDRLFAFDAATGVPRWSWSFPADVLGISDPGAAGGLLYVAEDGTKRIGTAPVVSAGVVYAGNLDGKVYAYDVGAFR